MFKHPDRLRYAAADYARFILVMGGYGVLTPDYQQPYDLMVQIDDKWNKVQIKTSTAKAPSGNWQFALRRSRNNATGHKYKFYERSECDYFMLIALSLNMWMIPFDMLDGMGSVTSCSKYDEYKFAPVMER